MPSQKPGEMSKSFQEQEAKNEKEQVEREGQEAVERTVVYWAPSPGYKIGNFVKEQWSGGRCIQAEVPLEFMNHIRVADPDTDEGREVIAFIEASNAFKANIIRRCKSMDQAVGMTTQLRQARQLKEIECTDVTSTIIQNK